MALHQAALGGSNIHNDLAFDMRRTNFARKEPQALFGEVTDSFLPLLFVGVCHVGDMVFRVFGVSVPRAGSGTFVSGDGRWRACEYCPMHTIRCIAGTRHICFDHQVTFLCLLLFLLYNLNLKKSINLRYKTSVWTSSHAVSYRSSNILSRMSDSINFVENRFYYLSPFSAHTVFSFGRGFSYCRACVPSIQNYVWSRTWIGQIALQVHLMLGEKDRNTRMIWHYK